ncbi:MAG: hypothetical protein OYH76_00680 [Defluviicoccus sp.]|nr:hypothetical protein [Defluviicoccus sp.]
MRDFVAGAWKVARFDRHKPSTKRSSRIVLASRSLPAFGAKPLDRIAPTAVRSRFDAFSRTAPGGASRTPDPFRQIMNFAIA